MKKAPAINLQNAREAQDFLKLLANARRLLILCHLAQGEKTVGMLAKSVGISHSALSQHLAKMRYKKLVTCDKRGQSVYYRLSSMEVQAILSTLYLIYCRE